MISVNNVTAKYDNLVVLENINMEIEDNTFVCVLGANGCGKSTLLKCIASVLEYSGTIKIDNVDVKKYKEKELAKKIAVLSQASNMQYEYTVKDTVKLGRYPYIKKGLFSSYSKNDNEVVDEILKTYGLWDIKDKYITQLSGGQLQRVYFARAMAQQPKILLLDEPTNHLDIKYQLEVMEQASKFREINNNIVVSVVHDINLAINFADVIYVINNGGVVFKGKPSELRGSNVIGEIYGEKVVEYIDNINKSW